MTSRGIRNNNPGNVVRDATQWQGMAAAQTDPRFVVFTTPAYGIRALAKVLLTYQHAHNLDTVTQIVSRWAPPSENDTVAYIKTVAKAVGVDADARVDLDSVAVMLPFVSAIIRQENGEQPYSAAQLLEGLHLAGIADAPAPAPVTVAPEPVQPKATMKSVTVWGGLTAALGGLVAAAGPFALRHLGMGPDEATQTALAVAAILSVLGGQAAVVGRSNPNIKPLG